MNHCLFVQWKNPTDASRYVIDGIPGEYSGLDFQDSIMKVLADVPKFKEICGKNSGANLSPGFRCSYSTINTSIFHFVEGNFEEKDFAGRKMVYIFMTNENDPIKAVEILKEYASLLGVTPHQEDLEMIKAQQFKIKSNHNTQIVKWTIIAMLTLLLLYTLQSLLSK